MNILLIDDHTLFREGLSHLLEALEPGVVLRQADSAEAGLALAATWDDIDLVLMDINLPGLSGIEGLQIFRRRFPSCPVVVLSGSDASEPVHESLDHGASGYIHKSASGDAMLAVLRKVLDGEIGLCPPPFFEPRAKK